MNRLMRKLCSPDSTEGNIIGILKERFNFGELVSFLEEEVDQDTLAGEINQILDTHLLVKDCSE